MKYFAIIVTVLFCLSIAYNIRQAVRLNWAKGYVGEKFKNEIDVINALSDAGHKTAELEFLRQFMSPDTGVVLMSDPKITITGFVGYQSRVLTPEEILDTDSASNLMDLPDPANTEWINFNARIGDSQKVQSILVVRKGNGYRVLVE